MMGNQIFGISGNAQMQETLTFEDMKKRQNNLRVKTTGTRALTGYNNDLATTKTRLQVSVHMYLPLDHSLVLCPL